MNDLKFSSQFARPVTAVLAIAVCLAVALSNDVLAESEKSAVTPAKLNLSVWPQISQQWPDFEERIDAVMAKMDDADKVGQIVMGEIKSLTPRDVRRYRLGGVLNGGGSFPYNNIKSKASDWLKLSQEFHDASLDLKKGAPLIPVLWGTDAVHGQNNLVGATLFPHNIGLGASANTELMREIGQAVAREVAASGIFWTFAPTITVPQDDRWGRTYEGFSEDPALVSVLGAAMIGGLQGSFNESTGTLAGDRVAATAKHFIGDGGTVAGVDRGDTRISESDLRTIHGESYAHAIRNNVLTVMASFNSWNGERLHGHQYLLTEVLKNRMGFKGFVVGDWDGHSHVPGCDETSCAQAVNAGVDMMMVPEKWKEFYEATLKDVRKGTISQERLDDAVRRILRVKFILGLFDGATPSKRIGAGDNSIVGNADHRQLARRAVRESLVLLKNNAGTLPIKKGTSILVVGDAAQDLSIQTGGWSVNWQGAETGANDLFPGAVSAYDGIRRAAKAAGATVAFSKDGAYKSKPDVALVFYGEKPYAEWYGDVKTLAFDPAGQKDRLQMLSRLRSKGIRIVSVFLSGRPMWVTREMNASDAFVAAWLPGTEGEGVADVLFCDVAKSKDCDFKGRLSFSWPSSVRDFHQNYGQEEGYEPLFKFGYGLSYASKHDDMPELAIPDLPEIAIDANSALGTNLFLGEAIAPYQL
ncbi:MAG: glycoside hydrolase family 3 protein, partial [Proteobacteria bacterium]|nr:glycoside hydrolase family 3 protein [Pseudomonadota bacterium]